MLYLYDNIKNFLIIQKLITAYFYGDNQSSAKNELETETYVCRI